MLTELCEELKNWFERDKYIGTFTIESGEIAVPVGSLRDGQFFRIIGSVFNDGVHQYPATDLHDEVFEGAIWAMAVPPAVIELSEEIAAWIEKYDNVVSSPYASESFGGYSYSKASSGQGSAASGPTWQSVYASKLNRYRKI